MTEHAFDPLALWRDMISKWEAGFNELASTNMASAELPQLMSQAMGLSARMQDAMGEMMGRYLAAMNMPTRADLAAISERLQGIEAQLGRLAAMVERLSQAAPPAEAAKPAAGGPPRKGPRAPSTARSAQEPRAAMPAAAAKPARRTKATRKAPRAR